MAQETTMDQGIHEPEFEYVGYSPEEAADLVEKLTSQGIDEESASEIIGSIQEIIDVIDSRNETDVLIVGSQLSKKVNQATRDAKMDEDSTRAFKTATYSLVDFKVGREGTLWYRGVIASGIIGDTDDSKTKEHGPYNFEADMSDFDDLNGEQGENSVGVSVDWDKVKDFGKKSYSLFDGEPRTIIGRKTNEWRSRIFGSYYGGADVDFDSIEDQRPEFDNPYADVTGTKHSAMSVEKINLIARDMGKETGISGEPFFPLLDTLNQLVAATQDSNDEAIVYLTDELYDMIEIISVKNQLNEDNEKLIVGLVGGFFKRYVGEAGLEYADSVYEAAQAQAEAEDEEIEDYVQSEAEEETTPEESVETEDEEESEKVSKWTTIKERFSPLRLGVWFAHGKDGDRRGLRDIKRRTLDRTKKITGISALEQQLAEAPDEDKEAIAKKIETRKKVVKGVGVVGVAAAAVAVGWLIDERLENSDLLDFDFDFENPFDSDDNGAGQTETSGNASPDANTNPPAGTEAGATPPAGTEAGPVNPPAEVSFTDISEQLGKPNGYVEMGSDGSLTVNVMSGSETNSLWTASETILTQVNGSATDSQTNALMNILMEQGFGDAGNNHWMYEGDKISLSSSQVEYLKLIGFVA